MATSGSAVDALMRQLIRGQKNGKAQKRDSGFKQPTKREMKVAMKALSK